DARAEPATGTGVIFDGDDAGALVTAVQDALRLVDDSGTLMRLRRNAMQAPFDWAVSAARYLRMYEELLGSHSHTPRTCPESARAHTSCQPPGSSTAGARVRRCRRRRRQAARRRDSRRRRAPTGAAPARCRG